MTSQKIHFISYGNERFTNSKKRIHKEASETGWFDSVTIYGEEDLDESFTSQFSNVLRQGRGGGYWIWKLNIIMDRLSKIEDDDILIYADAGCTINKHGETRFHEYIHMLNDNDCGVISFQINQHLEKIWTTRQIFEYFNIKIDSDIPNSGQIINTVLIMKKNPCLLTQIDVWYKTLCDDPLLITDHYNGMDQLSCFKDNRHEQSIFSVIRKQYNPILLEDETYMIPFHSGESLKYPFWATRIRG
jgi:hypothetical protein